LLRSVDIGKDQSYVLAVLTATQLAHAMFPIGDSTKAQVRDEAARRGLAVARKPDSHDICFIADGDTRGFLSRQLGERSGPIVDASTRAVVGRHNGSFGFTVGQRRGLHLDRAAPDGAPRYVLSLEPATNTVVVGPQERLEVTRIVAEHPVWTSGVSPQRQLACQVQLRAHGMVSDATVTVSGDRLVAELKRPQRGVAAGQALVVYNGETVVGSATIASVAQAAAPAVAG
jgi:tRNA-specific 2-thiouridylase